MSEATQQRVDDKRRDAHLADLEARVTSLERRFGDLDRERFQRPRRRAKTGRPYTRR